MIRKRENKSDVVSELMLRKKWISLVKLCNSILHFSAHVSLITDIDIG